jgi:hypothetical protein
LIELIREAVLRFHKEELVDKVNHDDAEKPHPQLELSLVDLGFQVD